MNEEEVLQVIDQAAREGRTLLDLSGKGLRGYLQRSDVE